MAHGFLMEVLTVSVLSYRVLEYFLLQAPVFSSNCLNTFGDRVEVISE